MSDASKIIVDEDWKTKVDREKSNEPAAVATTLPTDPPVASFESLLSMLFAQGLSLLGQSFDDQSPPPVNKVYARHVIDTVEMLGEKTKGNLSEQETKMHAEVLHTLRMAFVSVKAGKP